MAVGCKGQHRPECLNPWVLRAFASQIHNRTLALSPLAWIETLLTSKGLTTMSTLCNNVFVMASPSRGSNNVTNHSR